MMDVIVMISYLHYLRSLSRACFRDLCGQVESKLIEMADHANHVHHVPRRGNKHGTQA
jgi:hypothetical protein